MLDIFDIVWFSFGAAIMAVWFILSGREIGWLKKTKKTKKNPPKE